MFIISTQTDLCYVMFTYAKCSVYHDCHSENSSFGSSSGISGISSGDSKSSTSFLTGWSNIDPVADWTVTDLTYPLLFRSATRTLAMGHLFLRVYPSTISPSAKFLFRHVHLCLSRKPLQVLFTPPVPKFIIDMLYTPPVSPAVNIFSLELSWGREY